MIWLFAALVSSLQLPPSSHTRRTALRCDPLDTCQRELADVRAAYAQYLVKSHELRLSQAALATKKMGELEQTNSGLAADLAATQKAFAEYMAKAHDAKVKIVQDSAAEVARAEAKVQEVQGAFSEYMISAHEAKIAAVDKVQVEMDALTAEYRQHVEDTDEFIESQGNELQAARKTLGTVRAALRELD